MRLKVMVIVIMLLATTLSGCVGNPPDLAPASTDGEEPTDPISNPASSSSNTSPARTVREECYGLYDIPCFEPSIAVDPDDRIFAAVSVCQAIMRSTDGGRTFEALGLPELPPTAPPTTNAPGDCTLQIGPDGSLYWSAFHFQNTVVYPSFAYVGNHYGLHVARSDDGGETWAANTWVDAASHPRSTFHPDRQWLSFGDEGAVHLTFYDPYYLERSWIATSNDRGASFSAFQQMPVPEIHGNPIAEGNGTLHVPWFDETGGTYAVHITTSPDGGDTWSTRTVHTWRGEGNLWWPTLAEDPNGNLLIAWVDEDDRVLVTRETPAGEGEWSEPLRWNPLGTEAGNTVPSIRVHDGVVNVLWYEQVSDGAQSLVLGRAPLGTWNQSTVETHVLATYNASQPTTHFADMAVTPDGRGVFAWTDPERGLRLSLEVGPP